MHKKSSPIIDLRKIQIESGVKQITNTQNNTQRKEIDDVLDFDIPLLDEKIITLSTSESDNILDFDLPLYPNYQEKFYIEEYLDTEIPNITFIPESAKKYRHNNFSQRYAQIFVLNTSALKNSKSSIAIFLSICLFFVMSMPSLRMVNQAIRVKDNMLLQVSAGEQLLSNKDSQDLSVLASSLNEIADGFTQSSSDIADLQGNLRILLQFLPGLSVVQNSSNLTSDISNLISLSSELANATQPFVSKEINPFDTTKQVTLVDGVTKLKDINSRIIPALDDLSSSLSKFPISLVPGHKGDVLRQLQKDIPKLKQTIVNSEQYVNIFLNFVGADMLKRYVFIFQNNQELRATGGFIGSFGLMNIDKGVVKSLDIKEVYNPDGQLTDNILAPEPLQELTKRWYLRDSNWFADFPTSARKILSFYEKAGGVTPDGVISLTPTVIERLLNITGPIKLDDYGITINADNFVKITQYQTGVAYDRVENKPKQFIADLAPILINKLLSSDASQYQQVIEALNNSFQEKHILLYFLDPKLQETVLRYNLGGQLYEAPKDYLSVVHSNIGGFKTDGVMQDNLKLKTNIQADGIIKNQIVVSRAHKGGSTDYEWWNKDNINYMRVYLPKNSRILNVSGYTDKEEKIEQKVLLGYSEDVDLQKVKNTLVHNEDWDVDFFEESNKLVIGGWVITKPGEISEVMIEYELPFTLKSNDIYSLILQKQSGILGAKYQYTLELPSKRKVVWKETSLELQETEQGYKVEDSILQTDEYIGLQLK